jgi:hypothetical protein
MVVLALQQHFADVSARLGEEWSEHEPGGSTLPTSSDEPALRTA